MIDDSVCYQQASMHSATSFLNSFLKEWKNQRLEPSDKGDRIVILLDDEQSIICPIKYYSILGRHQYTNRFYQKSGDHINEINFEELVILLCNFLKNRFSAESSDIDRFQNRIFSSMRNIALSLQKKSDEIICPNIFEFSFKDSEQSLLLGHHFHPTPKSRDEFTDEDSFLYAPEFCGSFPLDWIMVDPLILHQEFAHSFKARKWTETLFALEMNQNEKSAELFRKNFIPIPMHPWQFKFLKNHCPPFLKYIQNDQIICLGKSKESWSATSSLRAVYRERSPYMLKFSMNLRLTNSVRNLLPKEVIRGLQLCDVLATTNGKKFLEDYPNFKIITEPAYFCLKNENGELIKESLVVCRENPFNNESSDGKIMVAALTQNRLFGEGNVLQSMIDNMNSKDSYYLRAKKWFSAYLQTALTPLFAAYSNYGLILEAHQQNLILDIQNGFPVAAYFRDCQDSGYSEFGYASFSHEVPFITRENGNVVNEKIGTRFFVYQVILNSTFSIISSLSSSGSISEIELLADLRNFLIDMLHCGVRDEACFKYLLDSPTLFHKGNFICAFKNIQDTTTPDPLSLYTPITNFILPHVNSEGSFHAA